MCRSGAGSGDHQLSRDSGLMMLTTLDPRLIWTTATAASVLLLSEKLAWNAVLLVSFRREAG